MKLTQVPTTTELETTERLEASILELRQRTWEKADAAIRRENAKEKVRASLWIIPVLALVAIWAWMMVR